MFDTAAECALNCHSVKSSLCLKLNSSEENSQIIALYFMKDDLNEPLLRIELRGSDGSPWLSGDIKGEELFSVLQGKEWG